MPKIIEIIVTTIDNIKNIGFEKLYLLVKRDKISPPIGAYTMPKKASTNIKSSQNLVKINNIISDMKYTKNEYLINFIIFISLIFKIIYQ